MKKLLPFLLLLPLALLQGDLAKTQGVAISSLAKLQGTAPGVSYDDPPSADLVAWYKADGDVYNTGTTQATDGQTVATWTDESVNGNDITQGTEGDKPLFQTSEQNGLAGIQFVSSDWLDRAALVTDQTWTVYTVFEASDDTASLTAWSINDVSEADEQFALIIRGGETDDPASLAARTGGTFAWADTPTGITINTAHVVMANAQSASVRKSTIDDGAEGSNSSSRAPAGIDGFSIGVLGDVSPGTYFDGYIYEIIVYDVVHDSATQTGIIDDLNIKWGI